MAVKYCKYCNYPYTEIEEYIDHKPVCDWFVWVVTSSGEVGAKHPRPTLDHQLEDAITEVGEGKKG